MSWDDELTKIRRLLRDPDGNIWSESFLRNIYNDTQQDVQHKTRILEELRVKRVPGNYHFSYMHDWEYAELPSKYSMFYQCLAQHDEGVFCHRWEPQEKTQIAGDVTDYGAHFTQPWEAFSTTPGELVKIRFPSNVRNLKYIAYDEEPIFRTTLKKIQTIDSSYITHSGKPIAYFEIDEVENEFVLYPRPSSAFEDEIDGNEGPAWYIGGDTEDTDTGTIAVRAGSSSGSNSGAVYDIADTENNVFLIYDVNPTEVETAADEGDYPDFLKKYVRYGVLARAYGANTDGRIQSLADYWQFRYERGIRTVKRFRSNKKEDRDFRMTTKGLPSHRRNRHPSLPSAYPDIQP